MFPIHILALGADPEVFLVNEAGQPHSAEGIFGGTKYAPKPMRGLPDGYFIQEDNVAAEYNIPPTPSVREWSAELQKGLSYIRRVAKRRKLAPFLAPNLDFPIDQLLTPHAQELGCDPDYNAWTRDKNPRPRVPKQMRTAAAHIHVSWEAPSDDQRWALVKALDLFLGVPSILATPKNERRQLYGRAGACRLKSYGIEYRVLDNFYLESAEKSRAVGERVFQTAAAISDNPMLRNHIEKMGVEIQHAINEHDQKLAEQLIEHFHIRSL